jgi:Cupin-like domain
MDTGQPLIIVDSEAFRDAFDRAPLRLNHNLATTRLFTLERIAALVEMAIDSGQMNRLALFEPLSHPGDGFAEKLFRKPHSGMVAETANAKHWLAIQNAGAVDPAYQELHREVIREVEQLLGQPLLERSDRGHLTVIVSSPGVVTPYHLDYGHNFLCHLAGTKEVWLWRPDDRATLSEKEIEGYYCGNMAAPRWRREAQRRALRFQLAPGDSVYQPPLAPHWVKNGPAVSISASFTISTPANHRRARIYRANPYLRRLGIVLPPPGRSILADSSRLAMMTAVTQWKRFRQRARRLGRADSNSKAASLKTHRKIPADRTTAP